MTLVSSYPKIGNLGPTDISERNKGEVGQPRGGGSVALGFRVSEPSCYMYKCAHVSST
jgi:hypothetical protein